jgi:transcriptional regulator with XRE-family HTH domain
MQILDPLIARLRRLKGGWVWREAAKRAGVSYMTISRISTGAMPNPGVRTCERLIVALDEIERLRAN